MLWNNSYHSFFVHFISSCLVAGLQYIFYFLASICELAEECSINVDMHLSSCLISFCIFETGQYPFWIMHRLTQTNWQKEKEFSFHDKSLLLKWALSSWRWCAKLVWTLPRHMTVFIAFKKTNPYNILEINCISIEQTPISLLQNNFDDSSLTSSAFYIW